MKNLLLLLFSVTAGLTLSGIAANLYRLLLNKEARKARDLLYFTVMVLAGPSVMLESATASYRARKCSRLAYGVAVAITGYWAFAIGLLAISIGLAL